MQRWHDVTVKITVMIDEDIYIYYMYIFEIKALMWPNCVNAEEKQWKE